MFLPGVPEDKIISILVGGSLRSSKRIVATQL